jgi:hypothetical protein
VLRSRHSLDGAQCEHRRVDSVSVQRQVRATANVRMSRVTAKMRASLTVKGGCARVKERGRRGEGEPPRQGVPSAAMRRTRTGPARVLGRGPGMNRGERGFQLSRLFGVVFFVGDTRKDSRRHTFGERRGGHRPREGRETEQCNELTTTEVHPVARWERSSRYLTGPPTKASMRCLAQPLAAVGRAAASPRAKAAEGVESMCVPPARRDLAPGADAADYPR